MKTIVVFTANDSEFPKIPELKDKVLSYMGGRSIDDPCGGSPHIVLRGTLDAEDRKAISGMVEQTNSQSITALLIEGNSNKLSNFIVDLKWIDNSL